jgi:hypothetical protein
MIRIIQSKFIVYNLIFISSVILLNPRYGTIDEFFISDFVNGNYTNENEFLLVFVQPIFGLIFKFFSILLGLQNVYSLIIAELIIFSLILFEQSINEYSKVSIKIRILFYVQSIFILTTYILQPTFTTAAVLIATISAINISQLKFSDTKFKLIAIWLLISSAILLRQEVIFILLLVLSATVIINLILRNKVYLANYVLGLGIIIPIVFINQMILVFSSNTDWKNYNLWNSYRHQLHNRISQFRLDEILIPGGWKPEEHNLFVDWAYGDPSIFNLDWIKIGYDYTSNLRGFDSILNLDFSYFIFNLNRYEIINNWALLFIAQIVLTLYVGFKFGLFKSLAISLLAWTPSTIIFIYSAFFLLLPQRVVLPLLLLPVMIIIGVGSKTTHLVEAPNIIWPVSIVLTILYVTFLTGINQSNILEKNANNQLLTDLKNFDKDATYLIPRCNNPYFSENPYKFTGKNRPIKILNVGCWDTFSPHWNNRKANFGLTSLSIYDDLFKEDVYWLGNFVPDTSINIENLLKNKGETNFTREVVKELSGDYVLFQFRKTNS